MACGFGVRGAARAGHRGGTAPCRARRPDLSRRGAGGPAAPGARATQPGAADRGAGGSLPQADAGRRAVAGGAEPRGGPGDGRWRDGGVPKLYDALETSDSAVKVLGEPTLEAIARELVAMVRTNV